MVLRLAEAPEGDCRGAYGQRRVAEIQWDRMENCLNSPLRHVGCMIPRHA